MILLEKLPTLRGYIMENGIGKVMATRKLSPMSRSSPYKKWKFNWLASQNEMGNFRLILLAVTLLTAACFRLGSTAPPEGCLKLPTFNSTEKSCIFKYFMKTLADLIHQYEPALSDATEGPGNFTTKLIDWPLIIISFILPCIQKKSVA